MKLSNRIIFAVVSLICLDSALIQRADASADQNLAGAIVSVKDLAYILPGGKASAKVAAKPGASIHVHDSITISDSGAVKILLSDHSIIDLGPSTVFKIDEYLQKHGSDREVEVSMKGGSVRGAVTEKLTGTGKFHLKTPSATMGVRGTEFVAQTDAKGATQFTVLQGQVEVAQSSPSGKSNSSSGSGASGKAVTVKAGQQVTSSMNAALPSKPITLSASALGKIASSTKFADNTFSKAVTIEASSKGGKGSDTGKDGKAKESRKPSSNSGNSQSGSSSSGSSSGNSSSGSGSSGSSSSGSAPASGSAPSSSGGSESGGGGGGSGSGPAPANAPASGGGDSSSGSSSSGGGSAASGGGPAPASVSGGGGDASGGGSSSSGGPSPASVSSSGGDASAASGGGGGAPAAGGGGGSTMSEIISTISASNNAPPIVNPAQSIAGAPNPVTQAAPVTTTNSGFSHVTINIHQ